MCVNVKLFLEMAGEDGGSVAGQRYLKREEVPKSLLQPDGNPLKKVRVAEFIARMEDLPPFSSNEEAFNKLCETFRAVKDDLTECDDLEVEIEKDANQYDAAKRMYPPNNMFKLDATLVKYKETQAWRQTQHTTYIGCNGAVLINLRKQYGAAVLLDKSAKDGRRVSDLK